MLKNKFTLKCRIEKMLEPMVKDKFHRKDVLAETIEENTSAKPQRLRFEFCKNESFDNIAKLNKFKVGDEVIIRFNIRGNEAKNKDGSPSGKVFNNLVAFEIYATDDYNGSGE